MGEANPQPNDETDEVFVDELKPGTELMHGQYTIDSFLNAGGFGITYNAKDSLGRRVVIKECFPGAFCRRSRYMVNARSRAHQNELQSIVRLFVQEAKSLAKLDHPNIVGVHNVFEENNTAYMALDFIEGRDLLDIIEDEDATLTPEEVERILREILGAVGFTHDLGILHRDISPDNILVDADKHPTLIDFGAAREQATKQSRVLSALRVVKDGYSPQEFYIQGSEQGPFSDLYALGASFYHLLAGEVPPNSQARLTAIASGQPDPYEPLEGTIPELSQPFLAALDKSLAVLPKDRVQSAGDWIAMMDGKMKVAPVAPTIVAAGHAASATSRIEQEKKSKLGLLLATTGVLALMAGAFAFTQTSGTEEAETPVEAPVDDVAVVEAPATAAEASEVAAAPVVVDPIATDPAPVVVTEVETLTAPEDPSPVVAEVEAPVVAEEPDTETSVDLFQAAAALAAEQERATEDVALSTVEVPEVPTVEANAEDVAVEADPLLAAIEEVLNAPEEDAPLASVENVVETSARVVSGESTDIVAPAGAPVGVSAGPFDILVDPTVPLVSPIDPAFLTLAGDLRRPSLRPADLDITDPTLELAAASSTTVEGSATDLPLEAIVTQTVEPQVTPSMPIDQVEFVSFSGVTASLDARTMSAIPTLPTLDETPVALPSADLPVYPFAAEVLPEPTEDTRVSTTSVPVLPFEGLFDAAVNETAILSVNGQAVETQEQFNAIVAREANLDILTEVTVVVGTGIVGTDEITEQELTLSVAQNTTLLNGASFQSTLNDGVWQTRVTAMPNSVATDLELGDIVLAYVPTTELLTDRTALADLLEREIAAGNKDFSFAVSRGGTTWVASITYDDSLYAAED